MIDPTVNFVKEERVFWIIVSDDGHSTKPKHHPDYQSAYNESIRLSKEHPGINFSVFQYVGNSFTPPPVVQKTTFFQYQPKNATIRFGGWEYPVPF